MTTTLRHPGPPATHRTVSVPTRSQEIPVELPPGARPVDAITAASRAAGVDSAQVELLSGTFDTVSYCVPAPCTDGSRAASYSDTRTADGPVLVIGGAATFGQRDGTPFLHCHLAWFDARGAVRAGHLWPDCTVGAVPVRAVLHPLPGIRNLSADDPETRMPVFTPHRTGAPPVHGRRVVMSRVLPGQDLHAAAHRVATQAGFDRALVRASIGSLVGPTLHHTNPTPPIPGPCTEVITLLGEVGPAAADRPLHVLAVDCAGAVHAGPLDAAHSPVAVTAELLLLEADPPTPHDRCGAR